MASVGAAALIVLACGVAFWPAMTRCGFLNWDDPQTVAANPLLKPPSWSGVAHYWRAPTMDLYVPVTYTAWSGIAFLNPSPPTGKPIELDPSRFHTANVIVHAVSTLFVWLILRRLTDRNSAAAS